MKVFALVTEGTLACSGKLVARTSLDSRRRSTGTWCLTTFALFSFSLLALVLVFVALVSVALGAFVFFVLLLTFLAFLALAFSLGGHG